MYCGISYHGSLTKSLGITLFSLAFHFGAGHQVVILGPRGRAFRFTFEFMCGLIGSSSLNNACLPLALGFFSQTVLPGLGS